jgi:hypothetical protein
MSADQHHEEEQEEQDHQQEQQQQQEGAEEEEGKETDGNRLKSSVWDTSANEKSTQLRPLAAIDFVPLQGHLKKLKSKLFLLQKKLALEAQCRVWAKDDDRDVAELNALVGGDTSALERLADLAELCEPADHARRALLLAQSMGGGMPPADQRTFEQKRRAMDLNECPGSSFLGGANGASWDASKWSHLPTSSSR